MDIAALGLRVESRGIRQGEEELKRFSRTARGAEQAAAGIGGASQRAAAQIAASNDNARRSVMGLQGAFAALRSQILLVGSVAATALAFPALGRAADNFTQFQNQLRVAGVASENLREVQDRLFESANRNGVAINALGQLYSRTSLAADELGASQAELLDLADGVTAALRVQGGSTSAASGALLQLSQALGAGVVRAEEFNSILEGALPIAQAAARGLDAAGGSVARLRTLVVSGSVSSREFFDALLEGFNVTQEQAQRATLTIGQSFNVLSNGFTAFVGTLDQSIGASAAFAGAIQSIGFGLTDLAGNLGVVGQVAQVVGITLAAAFGPAILSSVVALGSALITSVGGAITTIGVLIAANPIGALVTAFVAVTAAAFTFRDELSDILGVDVTGVVESAANTIIGIFSGAYNSITQIWGKLPAAIGDLAIQAANRTIDAVENMINDIVGAINNLFNNINLAALEAGLTTNLPIFAPADFGRIENQAAGAAREVGNIVAREMSRALGQDYFATLGDGVEESMRSAADAVDAVTDAANRAAEATGGIGSAASGAAGEAQKLADAYGGVAGSSGQVVSAIQDSSQGFRQFGRDLAGGFISDFRSALDQGKNPLEAFFEAGQRALDKLLDKLINDFLDVLFNVPTGGGGGGPFGGGFGGAGGGFNFFRGGGMAAMAAPANNNSGTLGVAGQFLGMNETQNTAAIASFLSGGGHNIDPQTVAWCAAFADAVLARSGLPTQGSLRAQDFLNYGSPTENPMPGDLAVFSRGQPGSGQGHVGFFQGYTENGGIRVIGGNQGGAAQGGGGVTSQVFDPERLLGFRSVGASAEQAAASLQAAQAAAAGAATAQQTNATAAQAAAQASNDNAGAAQTAASNVEQLGSSASQASSKLAGAGGNNTLFGASDALSAGSQQLAGATQQFTGSMGGILGGIVGVFQQLLGGLGGGGGGGIGGVLGIVGSLFGGLFAKGAAFSGGNVVPFASGGVVTKPTYFPMSGGRTGLMGEAGPEAVMPLTRMGNGKLGVQAGGGGRIALDVHVEMDDNANLRSYVKSTASEIADVRVTNSEKRQREALPGEIEAQKRNTDKRRLIPRPRAA